MAGISGIGCSLNLDRTNDMIVLTGDIYFIKSCNKNRCVLRKFIRVI